MRQQTAGALALGSILAATAPATLAQNASTSQLQIYGYLAPMIDYLDVSGASGIVPAQRPSMLGPGAYTGAGNNDVTRMQSSISYIGFRGSEDLGGGLSAFFQLEHGLQLDDGTITGPPGSTRFWNRNTAVGLRGKFGSAFVGSWDTPIAWSHLGFTNGVRNPYAGDSSSIFLTPGFNIPHSSVLDNRAGNPADAVFNRRQGNSLQYWSPKLAGFSLRAAYSLPEGTKTAANGARYAPAMFGVGGEYANGPATVRYVYQQHNDYFGLAWLGPNPAANPDAPGSTASSSKDYDHRVIARWIFTPQWTLQGAFDRQSFSADGVAAGRVERYSRNAWSAQVLYRTGPHTSWVNAGRADDGSCSVSGGGNCSTDGLGATMWSVGYRYDFSRRTDVFVSAYQVRNEDNAQYGVFPRPFAGIAPGSKVTGLTLGVEHSF